MSTTPPLFYAPGLTPALSRLVLEGGEAAHAIKSRRLRNGDPIHLTNGKGLLAAGTIADRTVKPLSIVIDLQHISENPRPHRTISLATALPKGDRQNVMLDMAAQLGVSRFIPLDCDYSVVTYQHKMRGRWQRIIESACKQSGQCYFPDIEEGTSPGQLLQELDSRTLVIFGDQRGRSLSQIAAGIIDSFDHVLIMVGPEGGFSAAELALFESRYNVHRVKVGNLILRTETACAALLASAHSFHH